jgi:hypothetical protein
LIVSEQNNQIEQKSGKARGHSNRTMSNKESAWTAAYDASKDSTVLQTSEVLPGVFVVKMNSPETHNMLTPLLMGALAREIDRLSTIEDEKVCIGVRLYGSRD